ncbi:hypothetical protein AGOR_G00223390 [Albula goreensis]|uniref:Cytochrome c oxidase assembly factor 3 n=1 Tax=Albula goreensis TaxID=1534307 RepID=A0A8T3CJI5_9TELE|nr:hypothetical protein AGOR_G00223390 [Albula goreensis]
MADKEGKGTSGQVAFVDQTDPKKTLSAAQKEFIRRGNHMRRLRGRNVATGIIIGTFVMGVFGYTVYSVSQEKIMDELDEEARIHQWRGPKTGANS